MPESKSVDGIFKAMTDADVKDDAWLLAFRQLSDGLKQTNVLLQSVVAKLDTAFEDIHEIKEQNLIIRLGTLSLEVNEMKTIVDSLVVDKNKRDGITSAVEYLSKVAPWITLLVIAALAGTFHWKLS